MRLTFLIFALLLAACSHKDKISLCGDHWWSCKYYDNDEQALAAIKAEEKHELDIAKNLDIDFNACAAVLLADQIAGQGKITSNQIYISLFGDDPSPELLTDLEDVKISALPRSKFKATNEDQSAAWKFSVSSIRKNWFGGYTAHAGYHCGSLCAGGTEYQLKRKGNSCAVVARRLLWVS